MLVVIACGYCLVVVVGKLPIARGMWRPSGCSVLARLTPAVEAYMQHGAMHVPHGIVFHRQCKGGHLSGAPTCS
jgi:hypothetical protein